eukprot:1005712-Prymnesium_polylepis.1
MPPSVRRVGGERTQDRRDTSPGDRSGRSLVARSCGRQTRPSRDRCPPPTVWITITYLLAATLSALRQQGVCNCQGKGVPFPINKLTG